MAFKYPVGFCMDCYGFVWVKGFFETQRSQRSQRKRASRAAHYSFSVISVIAVLIPLFFSSHFSPLLTASPSLVVILPFSLVRHIFKISTIPFHHYSYRFLPEHTGFQAPFGHAKTPRGRVISKEIRGFQEYGRL
jgi:hypothetical protein